MGVNFSRVGTGFQPNGNKGPGRAWKKVLSEREMLEGDMNQLFNSFIPYEVCPNLTNNCPLPFS